MAKKPKSSARSAKPEPPSVLLNRAIRLHRLVSILGEAPRTRDYLTHRLRIDVRDFYRDLRTLRQARIEISKEGRCFHLQGKVEDAVPRLPFPDPHLTLGQALLLARGRTAAHRRLKQHVERVLKKRTPSR